ncbi:bacteriocin immunity protein [Pectobacterium parmentieri]|uniref:Bacteriocin immunity protein n=1 Tax=Pectobacterium parmentieri TaxID=1905730 RepID=A0A0H3I7T2_PECPM|nr:bacteriocin immunity protein [Pectobacterium parmentieri]AFI90909.1 Colicin-E7 immunity protein (ImmE7) (Microcin-E7 immunity protein) [Pectobacterium parmentieri]MBI0470049.1 bacteriocin immunity protein [Pectobacterium parmentieri]MBI0492649.1 bacteriocin immunity protein [Pectobacterium parmentieri]MBI0553788.1 bacteriocin immunity protein [Pectobacterium parmentieri]MBI0564959.1 bacteriocin immunity protein [Pectobacterium parmentieri]
MKYIVLKDKISEYTEDEFVSLLKEFRKSTRQAKTLKGKDLKKYLDDLLSNFILVSEHPEEGDLIAYPETPEDGEPERIFSIVKEWRKSQGLPLFKDSE